LRKLAFCSLDSGCRKKPKLKGHGLMVKLRYQREAEMDYIKAVSTGVDTNVQRKSLLPGEAEIRST